MEKGSSSVKLLREDGMMVRALRRVHAAPVDYQPQAQPEQEENKKEPLALQQVCFVHVIHHLEDFPPNCLALLPQRIRRELLLCLPAADLCPIERTAVVEGIEMNEIWGGLCERLSPGRPGGAARRLLEPLIVKLQHAAPAMWKQLSDPLCTVWKELFAIITCSLLLHISPVCIADYFKPVSFRQRLRLHRVVSGDFLSLLQYLFCSAYLSAKHIRTYGGLSLVVCGQVIRPKRFAEYLDKCDSMKLMRYVIERCRLYPKCLFINCISSARSSLFRELRVNEENMQTLRKLLCEVRQVEFVIRTGFRMYLRAQEHIYLMIESVLSSQNPQLESLTIQAREAVVPLTFKPSCGTLVKGILTDIASLFVDLPRKTDTASPPCPKSSIVPYHGLKKLNISTTGIWKPGGSSADATASEYFIRIAQSQTKLESLHISRWWVWSEKSAPPMDFNSLCSLFFHSNLSYLHFHELDLPAAFVQGLIRTFLYVSSTSHRELILHSVWMYDEPISDDQLVPYRDNTVPNPEDEYSGLEHKTLRLVSMYISNPFITWLSTLKFVCLKELELTDLQYDSDMKPGGILGALGRHSSCQIANVDVSSHTVDCPKEGLEVLLQHSSVNTLNLVGAKKDLLESLACGLVSKPTMDSLQILSISIAQLKPEETEEILFKDLFKAILSLSQLPSMTLDFSIGGYHQYAAVFHDAWKSYGNGKQLGKLILNAVFPSDVDEQVIVSLRQQMNQIAVEVDIRTQTVI